MFCTLLKKNDFFLDVPIYHRNQYRLSKIPKNVTQNGFYIFFGPDTSILRAVALKSPGGLVSFG